MASTSADAPTCKCAATGGPATRQLHFAYRPVNPVRPSSHVTSGLLHPRLQEISVAMAPAPPTVNFRDAAGVLGNKDRFFLKHAASAMEDLQSKGIAGRAVIHLSTSCLTDPLLPVYVISLFQRRGVSLAGIHVTLGTGSQRCPTGGILHDAALESPQYVRHHTDERPNSQPSWVNAMFGRLGIP